MSQFAPESEALFAAMSPAPNYYQRVVIDTFMREAWLPVWNNEDAIYVYDTFAEQPSLLNWKNPTESGILHGGIVFHPYSGWQGNGTNAWIELPGPLSAYTLNSAHVGGASAQQVIAMGANPLWGDSRDGQRTLGYFPRNLDNLRPLFVNTANGAIPTPPSAIDDTQLTIVNRISSTTIDIYDNGDFVGTGESSTTALATLPIRALSLFSGGAERFGDMRSTIQFWGGALTPAQIAAINTAWLKYKAAMIPNPPDTIMPETKMVKLVNGIPVKLIEWSE